MLNNFSLSRNEFPKILKTGVITFMADKLVFLIVKFGKQQTILEKLIQ